MSAPNDGGPAFAKPQSAGIHGDAQRGISVRDWYAGQALAGMCAFHGTYGEGNGPGENAERAFEQADAMLAERERRS